MKAFFVAALTLLSLLLCSQGFAASASLAPGMKPVPTGQAAPNFAFSLPLAAPDAAALGLKPNATSPRLNDVQAQAVVIVVFSMYCTYCQGEAPELAALDALIRQKGLSDTLKLIGLGAGNSAYEVNLFRKKYNLDFPLLSDPDYVAHKALGEVGTPYYYILKRTGKGFVIVDQRLGRMSSVPEFLNAIVAKTGLR